MIYSGFEHFYVSTLVLISVASLKRTFNNIRKKIFCDNIKQIDKVYIPFYTYIYLLVQQTRYLSPPIEIKTYILNLLNKNAQQ